MLFIVIAYLVSESFNYSHLNMFNSGCIQIAYVKYVCANHLDCLHFFARKQKHI